MQSTVLQTMLTPQKKKEESKYQIIEERYLKINEYLFGLGDILNTPRGLSKIVNIASNEISELNSEYRVSQSILNFTLLAKADEFADNGVKVLTTRTLMQMNSSATFQCGKKMGEILQDAINGSAFKYQAVVLPIISQKKQQWDLYIIMHSKWIFNTNIESKKQMAIDIVKALGSSVGGGKKKNKIKPRLIHVKGGKDSVIEKEVIYESLNQHFSSVMPGQDIVEYLKQPQLGSINEQNLIYQPINIKNQKQTGSSGGYLIFSFLSQVFLKNKPFTPDLKNINFQSWFSNIDLELDQIKKLLQQIPGTKMVQIDGEIRLEKRGSFFLATPESQSTLLQKLKQNMTSQSQQENKLMEQSMEESRDSINSNQINEAAETGQHVLEQTDGLEDKVIQEKRQQLMQKLADQQDHEDQGKNQEQAQQVIQNFADQQDHEDQMKDEEQAQQVKQDLVDQQDHEDQMKDKEQSQQVTKDQADQQDHEDQGKDKKQPQVQKAPQNEIDAFQQEEDDKKLQKKTELEKDQESDRDSFKGSYKESDYDSNDESDQEDNKNVQKIKWSITKPFDKAGSGIYFFDDEEYEDEKKTKYLEQDKKLVKQEIDQESDKDQQAPLAASKNDLLQNGNHTYERRIEQCQQSQETQSQNQLGILIEPKLPQNQQKNESNSNQAQKLESQQQDDDDLQAKGLFHDKQEQENAKEKPQDNLNLGKQQEAQIVLSQSQAPIKSAIQPVQQQIIQVSQQVSQEHQGMVQSSPPPVNFQSKADQTKNYEQDEQQAQTQMIDAQFQVLTQKVTVPQSRQNSLSQELAIQSQLVDKLQESQFSTDNIQINNNDIERLKNNNDIPTSIPGFDQQTSKTQEQLSIQQKSQKQDKQVAEQSQQASNTSFPHQTQQEQSQTNNLGLRFQSQIQSVHESMPINLIQAEQDQKYNDSQQKSPLRSSLQMPQFHKDDGNVSKDLDTTPPNQEIQSEDKSSILNSIPHSPQKMQLKKGQNHQDIRLDMVGDINLNNDGNKQEKKNIYEEEDKEELKNQNGESKLASADQIFTDEDDLKSQSNRKPSELLAQNIKAKDGLLGVRLPASSGYQYRSPITTDDSPDKIDAPDDFRKKMSKKSKRMDLEIQGKSVNRPSRQGGCCGSCKIL